MMSVLEEHPGFLEIEDRLDAIGQRYRVWLLLRGLILFGALGVVEVVGAGFLGSWLGAGWGAWGVAVVAGVGLVAGFIWWVGRPLIFRPKAMDVARLVESRVAGVHNALSNGLLLRKAGDLRGNPWMDPVMREIARTAAGRPLQEAVRFGELRRVAWISWGIALPVLGLGLVFGGRVAQGMGQVARPGEFVPRVAEVKLVEVRPGNTTVIRGKGLEITVIAEGEGDFSGQIFFEGQEKGEAMTGVAGERGGAGARRFTYVREHVDEDVRYRVEVGQTQSPWYQVRVVRQVALTGASMKVRAPAYTKRGEQVIEGSGEALAKQVISVAQGSRVEVAFETDMAMAGGMLQVGEGAAAGMRREEDGRRFVGEFVVKESGGVSLLLVDGGGQIVGRLPERAMAVECRVDAPPTIEMTWPKGDLTIAPAGEVNIEANLRDDYGLSGARLIWGRGAEEGGEVAAEQSFSDAPAMRAFKARLQLKGEEGAHGRSIWVQVEAMDNRDLLWPGEELGPQTARGKRVEIRFRDPEQLTRETVARIDRLRQEIEAILKKQNQLHAVAQGMKKGDGAALRVHAGQQEVKGMLLRLAETFEFAPEDRLVQKTLQALAGGAAQEAVDYALLSGRERETAEYVKVSGELLSRQRRVIQILENLLALLRAQAQATTQPARARAGDMVSPADAYGKLDEVLKQFIKEEQRILDQTAGLAKKPVDNFDQKERALLAELKQSQEKLDAFMQQKVNDFSNMAEQDMANASMLKELLAVYSEVTMAKNALNEKAVEMAISHEEMGLELAKETSSNIEKWLMEKPDRMKWTQEDQMQKTEAPMAELPVELEDMVGELMEEQEDLFEEMEDASANWHESADKGAGWDAMDGPIDNMTAKGVTGNQLPNNNEMGGRSGEGRSGKSQGEMVGDSAVGKGGRNTPTRLDPTAFAQGQIKDSSKDPVGGATGGGKLSGQGAAGLEGPTAPQRKELMERLKQKQAELRNTAERLNLQYKLGNYDNFKMLEAVAIMRRVESDLSANRYQNAMRRKDILLDALDNSRTMVGGEIAVQHDSTPAGNRKRRQEINDAMKGGLPPAWENALKEYYRKLGEQ